MRLILKGLEQVKPPRDIHEWEAGEPHEGKEKSMFSATAKATASLMLDSMIKAADKGVRLMPDAGTMKSDEAEKGGDVKKDFEHMAGEYKKMPPPSPASQKQATSMFGPSASQEGPAAKKQAMASAGPSSATKQALASIKPTAQARGGATGAVKDAPAGVLTSAPSQPKMAPRAPSLKPGQSISMQSVAKPGGEKKVAGMSKSREAIEMLKGMIAKASDASHSAGNPANEQGRVTSTPHGGSGPAQTSVSGTPHAGSGPAQTSVSGRQSPGNAANEQGSVSGTPHGGIGPAQTSVSGAAFAGNEGNMNKAVGAAAVPRMPRGMAMAMDQWRSATSVMTRGNSRFAKHAGTGPLNGEVIAQVEEDSNERATRRGQVLKACGGCGRTYTLRKSDDGCPTCSNLHLGVMAKSRGGLLIPAGI